MGKSNVKGLFVLLIFAVVLSFIYNYFSPNGIALFGRWDTEKGLVRAISKSDKMSDSNQILEPAVVEKMIADKMRMIIDVRHSDDFALGHLPGAVSYPLDEFDNQIQKILLGIKRAEPLLIYCSGPECNMSHIFAERLTHLKYTDIKIFSGGYRAWKDSGQRIEKNEN